MVKYSTLIKVISLEVNKCKATENALNIGDTGLWSDMLNGDGKTIGSRLTYSNGLEIRYDNKGNISSMMLPNGEELDYLKEQCYDFFKDQRQKLIKQNGEGGYEFFKKFYGIYQSHQYMYINNYLRGRIGKDFLEKCLEGNFNFISNNFDNFNEPLNQNKLSVYDDFFTVRAITKPHDNDALNRRIVKDKAYTSSSVGKNTTELMKGFGDKDEGYLVITYYQKGNKASKGVFVGGVSREIDIEKYGINMDEEKEVLSPSNQKFERQVIDRENRIIYQIPYEP